MEPVDPYATPHDDQPHAAPPELAPDAWLNDRPPAPHPDAAFAPPPPPDAQLDAPPDAPPVAPPAQLDASPDVDSSNAAGRFEAQPSGTVAEPAERATRRLRVEIGAVEGDLRVVGGADTLSLDLDDENETIIAQDRRGALRFDRLPGDTTLHAPDGAELVIRLIDGDLRVDAFDGGVSVRRVAGEALLDGLAAGEIEQTDGDLRAIRCGSLTARLVAGDVDLDRLSAIPAFSSVAGDLEGVDLPGLRLEALAGDLTLRRCGDIIASGVGGEAELAQIGALRLLSVGGDLAVEQADRIEVETVGGDATVRGIAGAIRIRTVGGDLEVETSGGVPVQPVGGVEIDTVGGDAEARDVAGAVRIRTIGGNLEAENVTGGLRVDRVAGDAELDSALDPAAEYAIDAGGELTLRLRGAPSASIVAQTRGGEIKTRLPLTVERGRRRHAVGKIGRGETTVTLRAGGDISITGADSYANSEGFGMSDDFTKRDDERANGENANGENATGENAGGRQWSANVGAARIHLKQERDEAGAQTFEGGVNGQTFRVRVENGAGRANVRFEGPKPEGATSDSGRDFTFEWEKGRGAHTYGEYAEQLKDLGAKAESVARQAADEARHYAEMGAQKVRETDWEAVGREVRGAVGKAMADLEQAFDQVRREYETRRSSGSTGAPSGSGAPFGSSAPTSGAQRVRIEQDEPQAGAGSYNPGASGATAGATDDADAQRRAVLEELRAGVISLDEAERRLNALR